MCAGEVQAAREQRVLVDGVSPTEFVSVEHARKADRVLLHIGLAIGRR